MFTGLIQDLGRIDAIEPAPGLSRLGVETVLADPSRVLGESIAVDGVCLTLVSMADRILAFDVIEETLRCTTLGKLIPGSKVNIEPALCIGDRLGGHLVQGHVDGTAELLSRDVEGGDHRLWFPLDDRWRRYIARKGSVTLNGVSLTVAGIEDRRFSVALIPETLQQTNLGTIKTGARVNVEVDLIARYLETLHPGES
jgi:riboflavin synthase